MSSSEGVPDTAGEIFELIAGFLDLGDQAVERLAHLQGKDLKVGKSIQQDLRTVAVRLVDRPELDAAIRALFDH